MTERAANRFQGAVALVTGAARGIGRGIALKLAAEGASIVVNDLGNMELADRLVQEIHNMGREAFSWQADVSDRTAVVELMAATRGAFRRLDVAVATPPIPSAQGLSKPTGKGSGAPSRSPSSAPTTPANWPPYRWPVNRCGAAVGARL